MKPRFMLAAALLSLATLPATAHAWFKVKNSTPNMVWVTHAFASTDGAFCGFYDSCPVDDSTLQGWRVQGWWAIAPGGTVTVHSEDWHAAWRQYFATDLVGHTWGAGGKTFAITNDKFNVCGTDGIIAPGHFRQRYGVLSVTRCCGLACSPNNYTLNLIL